MRGALTNARYESNNVYSIRDINRYRKFAYMRPRNGKRFFAIQVHDIASRYFSRMLRERCLGVFNYIPIPYNHSFNSTCPTDIIDSEHVTVVCE